MKFSEIKNDRQLWEFMTSPSERLVNSISKLEGPVMILGGSGKMGKELIGLIRHADNQCEIHRDIFVASTFSDPKGEELELFRRLEVHIFKGDLSEEKFLKSLPDAPNVVYMMGFKFGSSGDWQRAFHLNSVVPYLVGRKYRNSKIVVFSSGNPYPHTSKFEKGCAEDVSLEPTGIYGWSIVARESSFRITAGQNPQQKVAFYRLMYAQHLCYGVLIDLARMIMSGKPITLAMPAVNLISQRDANEVALRSFELCSTTPQIINVAGPAWQVREIVSRLEKYLNRQAILLNDEADRALLADDSACLYRFGEYRDDVEDMIKGTANWVKDGGTYWNKPTFFGRADHNY